MPKAVFGQLVGCGPAVAPFADGNFQSGALFETQTFQKGRFFIEQYCQSFGCRFGGLDGHTDRRFFFFQTKKQEIERRAKHDASNLRQCRPSGIRCCHHPLPHSPEAYGRYLIRNAGHFAYDPDLEDFYDYEKCGLQRMAQETGCFTVFQSECSCFFSFE